MRIAVIAALPGELKPLVKGWLRLKKLPGGVEMWQRPDGADDVVAVCGGMGAAAAKRAFAAAEFGGALDLVLSVGWAGGLGPESHDGRVHVASEIIDAQTGERFSLTDGKRKLRLVTTPHVADAAEKRRLWETYGAVLVDMEAAVIARLAQIRGIPMCCFKAVSDGPDARLPDINPFINGSGKLKLAGFLGHVALRPRYWGSLVEMGRRSGHAAVALAATIEKFLIEKNVDRANRTGEV